MDFAIQEHPQKLFIGLPLRTNNNEMHLTVGPHKEKFLSLAHTIPHKLNDNVLGLYTDYEGDHTKPFTYVLGYEVSSLTSIPPGFVGKTIPATTYAIFGTSGPFPQALVKTWQTIWGTPLSRAFSTDFEFYPADFNPFVNSTVKVHIAIK